MVSPVVLLPALCSTGAGSVQELVCLHLCARRIDALLFCISIIECLFRMTSASNLGVVKRPFECPSTSHDGDYDMQGPLTTLTTSASTILPASTRQNDEPGHSWLVSLKGFSRIAFAD